MGRGKLIVVSGFSGAGKGSIMRELLKNHDNYVLSISMTTRAPREGEVHGREYFFVERAAFEEAIAQNGLLEHAEYIGHLYGTPRAYVEEQLREGKNVMLEIDVQGGMQIREKFPDSMLLFVVPPSAKVLKERLLGRNTENIEQVKRRLLRALDEAPYMEAYDYIVVNDDLEACVEEVHAVISGEKAIPEKDPAFIERFRDDLQKMLQKEGLLHLPTEE
ncbi:MAG: guanylate kinase [Lachnospiraceae bacterium]|nr:guanylate kinase [Lachnospiraceae bacterium]